MKIRNKSRKIDINKVFIEKDAYGGTNISIIVNNQLIEIYTKHVYIDDILDKIKEYTKVIGG